MKAMRFYSIDAAKEYLKKKGIDYKEKAYFFDYRMKKLLLAYAILLAGCAGKTEAEHKHIVISNDYQDTCMIVANGYRTIPIECKKGSKSKNNGTITIFLSNKGNSQVCNVNNIICKIE